jgi:quinol monooxygenase YgiN
MELVGAEDVHIGTVDRATTMKANEVLNQHSDDKHRGVTLINVFTVSPADQQRLVDLLTRATDDFVRHAPGFISSLLHRSVDGSKVTMYAQWRSVEDYEAMRQDPRPRPFLEEALSFAKFEPGMYKVVRTFLPAGK